jgi:hypothetical protein
MLSSKLRKRRAPSSAPILPLHYSQPSEGTASRKKKGHRQTGRGNATTLKRVALCCSMTILTIMGVLRLFPLFDGSQSEKAPESLIDRLRRYHGTLSKAKITREKKEYPTIHCSDGTTGFVDDDYCDCPDGVDEPNTAACSNVLIHKETFRCRDGLKMIFASHVKDGVVDCSDGSDETP